MRLESIKSWQKKIPPSSFFSLWLVLCKMKRNPLPKFIKTLSRGWKRYYTFKLEHFSSPTFPNILILGGWGGQDLNNKHYYAFNLQKKPINSLPYFLRSYSVGGQQMRNTRTNFSIRKRVSLPLNFLIRRGMGLTVSHFFPYFYSSIGITSSIE